MSNRITAGTRQHTTSDYAQRQVRDRYGAGHGEIEDGVALTIASWWASPGRTGMALAELATSGSADVTELLEDIAATRDEANYCDRPQDELAALDMLATWALNHPSR